MNGSWENLQEQLKKIWNLLREPIFNTSGAKISASNILISLLVIFITVFAAKHIGSAINGALRRRNVDSGVRDSLEKFFRYLLIAVGVLFSLDNLGVSINSLAAVGAVLMVGIGFGLQNITQNFISGIIILIERPIKVGDIIRVGTSTGRVSDIRVRSTIIQTRDDIAIIIPNSKILSEEVINECFTSPYIRQHVRVGVAYGSDTAKVISILETAARGHEKVMPEPSPRALLEDFGDSSLNFDLRFWCADIWTIESISSEIRLEIDRAFREDGVEIPFPQRDLHLRSGFSNLVSAEKKEK